VNINVVCAKIQEYEIDAVVVNLFEGVTEPGGATGAVNRAMDGVISNLIASGDFTGKLKQIAVLYPREGIVDVRPREVEAKRVAIVGLGKREEFTIEKVRQVASAAAKHLRDLGVKRFATILHGAGAGGFSPSETAQAVTEGTLLGLYSFTEYKTVGREEIRTVEEVTILEADPDRIPAVEEGIRFGTIIAEGTSLARDLSNLPGNTLTPTALADRARGIAEAEGISITVLGPEEINAEKMGALAAVAQGSDQPARFIVMEYRGSEGDPVVIVGKGVTFDSGGISIKPSEKMEEMKHDMSGAASVLGTMQAVARLRLPVHLIGLIPATENLPSGRALKPGDIITTMSGKTVEIISTDAEGRLILADALTYAVRYQPAAVIDLATLTGACVIALGSEASGLMANNQDLVEKVRAAGEATCERVWQLPLYEEYDEQITSDVADVKNSGGRPAGAITAAAFLKKFAEGYPWVHLDIAGTDYTDKDRPYSPKGATGVGVRLLVQLLRNWA
jgi:leucyl aminopeptidase